MTTSATHGRRVLIVGLGIAGIATALRLHRAGWEPVIIERAPERRKGGYFIGLFGTGQASAKRLGVLEAMGNRNHPQSKTFEVDRANRRRKGMAFADVPGAPRMLLRGDVENALFDALPEQAEIRFSTVPTRIEQGERGAEVTMTHTKTGATVTERFDLVVGADGMRSTVRKLVFGLHEDYLYPLNYMIGAAILSKPVRGYNLHDGLVLAEAGRSAWVFPFADHNPGVLFSYRVDDVDAQFRRPPIESLRKAYGPEPAGPVLRQLLDDFAAADEYLFDSVNQVRMNCWHKGRVVLVGDAAWCLTLYSGMGASTGLAGSELLGNMLEKYPDDVGRALVAWEEKLRPFITELQADGVKMRAFFTPSGEAQRILRSAFLRLASSPVTRPIFERLTIKDKLKTRDIVVQA
ncbi:FAD-dependent monooxygenase [Polyangium jinanense]|uniref:FAD-dependent monooxygenase n=1 Tax=Polyangium jinanense TaxID=2829994 RepID=A0A9X4AZ51_9BACT|nr:FAD-dependent monooxygenase [Polyangium jinanense]MDC3961880.1 FAD-dependent monooxygenase [Polyangium jinanense]MDC3987802.1 FAD-dependent monooxygenase [Polyangium jinanense]